MKHIQQFEEFINEAANAVVKPNAKLKSGTGFPYASFYLSTQALDIMVNFEDPDHIAVIKLLADQEKEMKDNGFLSKSSMDKARTTYKRALGYYVVQTKYDGPDITYRLSSTPDANLDDGSKKQWLTGSASSGGGVTMAKYI
jgi:hypothetical protein